MKEMKFIILFIISCIVVQCLSLSVEDVVRKRRISLHVPIREEGDFRDLSEFDREVSVENMNPALGYEESFGFYLDGTSRMNVPSLILRPRESIGMTIRVKPSSGSSFFLSGSCSEGLRITLNSDSKWCLGLGNDNEIVVGPSVRVGKWTFLGAAYDSGTGVASLLVDGEAFFEHVHRNELSERTSEFSVGSCTSSDYNSFRGVLDSVAVRSTSLQIEELVAIRDNAHVSENVNSPGAAKYALSVRNKNGYVEIGSDFPNSYIISEESISSISVQASIRPSVENHRDSGLFGIVDLKGLFSLLLRRDGESTFRLVVRVASETPTNWITPILVQENEWNVVSFVWSHGRIHAYRFGAHPSDEESFSMEISASTHHILPRM